jgi:F-type H+-transporting ATPase subunit delta
MASRSAKSLTAILDAVDEAIAAGADGSRLGDDLLAVVALLDSEPTLRRILTEPAVPAEAKTSTLQSLLEGKVSDQALKVVDEAVRSRWSRSADLANVIERAAITAIAIAAEADGKLDDVEDELFRFGRILESEPQLREALSDRGTSVQAKRELLKTLLSRRAGKPTRQILDQLVVGRQRTLTSGLEFYETVAAASRERLLATAWVAAPLKDEHKERLTAALTAQYSRKVHLNVVIDTDVMGGIRVAIGDDVIDSSIKTRLADVRRKLNT